MVEAGGAQRGGWRNGLTARFTALTGLLLVALAGAVVACVAFETRRDAADRMVVELARDVRAAAEALGRGDEIHAVLNALSARSHALYVTLDRRGGETIVALAPAAPSPEAPREALIETGGDGPAAITVARGAAHALKTVALSGGGEAVLGVGVSLADADAAGAAAAARGLFAALAVLLVGLPAFALIARRTFSPLCGLALAINRVDGASVEVDRAALRRDEIGDVARAHRTMTREVFRNADALRSAAFDDPLTRLLNRDGLNRRLSEALQVGQGVALLKIEVGGLERVATGLGPVGADAAVHGAAARVREVAVEWSRRAHAAHALGDDLSVSVARIGEAQFALLAHGAGEAAAEDLARLTLAAFEAPLRLDEHRVGLSPAIGVAFAPLHGDRAEALMRSAGAALAAARLVRGPALRIAGAELNDRAYSRLRIEQELRRALVEDELEVHFQPQLALGGGRVTGAEALVRWRHPVRGLIAPGEFVPVAEETGLVEPLGRFVLAEASRQAAAWAAMGIPIRVAVNVSPLQFRNPRFSEAVLQTIREAGVDPSRIELEITESAAMADPSHAARELAPLRSAGVRIAIDDFGTGYSNFAALTQLPFDVLKIDRSFVRDALVTPGARVVVEAVLGLARNLDVETVAEGVETEEQRAFVTAGGCTFGQGYLFGRPMPAEAFEAWYANRLGTELRAVAAEAQAQPRARHAPARSVVPLSSGFARPAAS
ncbi:putative signal transduction protein with EAL and GGDEF domain [Methylopila capsulata]|uniref:Signal transduction protein with EAL and GGDEF domain n=1 Tax=Methylopila capsulata TaxID=61654 RepID=A0A9W6MQP1_9HYPH|nr:GGDEF domain-containing phosphodiesterase [Methylopila capsulata]MBM7851406.1 putative signal transduction protein with EAL and GGDEF domain [Methylopila capsulata]GLK54463.1 hypothetical protein GCM10008170_04820 [Methylopila capsulata]